MAFLFPSPHLLQLQLNDLFLERVSFILPLHVSLFHTVLLSTEKGSKESALLWRKVQAHKSRNFCAEKSIWQTQTHSLTDEMPAGINPHVHRKKKLQSYLCIIDLSYSSPSGVFMMANSSRVTWHRAGFSIDAEIVLMSCGSTLPGESRERDPTAFMDDYQENKGKSTMISIPWYCFKRVCPAEVGHVTFFESNALQVLFHHPLGIKTLSRILLSCWYTPPKP